MIRLAYGCTLLAVVCAPALGLAETQDGGKGNHYAFLVGCSNYIKTEFRELPYAGNDVMGFRAALIKTGFPEADVVVLHDSTKDPRHYLPQKANILRELDLLLAGIREQDTLVVALSGHGLQVKGDPVSYFVPVDGQVGDKSTLIALGGSDGLYERLQKCKARQKLLILNATRGDPTVGEDLANRKIQWADEDRNEVPDAIAAIFSCTAGQKSYFDPDLNMSLFFCCVNKAWKGQYTSGGELTLEKFFGQVMVKTRIDFRNVPAALQTPAVQREYTGKWVILSAAEVAKVRESERLLASDLAEFTRLWLKSGNKAALWLEQHAPARLAGWREAANGGSPDAMVLLGECLENGRGLPKDEMEAVKWYRKAAEQGNAWGQAEVGRMYASGRGVAKDDVEAVKWYRKSAKQGNAVGQTDLGLMYENGRGVAKDHVEAVKWYRKAADQGNAWGQNNLGLMYQDGRGVPKDEVEAANWYRKAAEQGHADGQCNLGVSYENGEGVPKDYAEAMKWYRKSAEQGNTWGQTNLGLMYEAGRGVRKDVDEAVRWYRLASQGGNPLATDALRRLGKQ